MTISVTPTHPSSITQNNHGKSSKIGNALRSIALGTAIGLGTLAPTAAVAQEKPPENVPVQEEPAPANPQPANPNSCTGRFAFGYIAGVIMEKLLTSLRNKREKDRSERPFGKLDDVKIIVEQPPAEKTDGPVKEEKKS